MFRKILDLEYKLFADNMAEMINMLQTIINYTNTELPLCKKHSAIFSVHNEFDTRLHFIKASNQNTYSPELIKLLDQINIYLIEIIRKRLYDNNNQNLNNFLLKLTREISDK